MASEASYTTSREFENEDWRTYSCHFDCQLEDMRAARGRERAANP